MKYHIIIALSPAYRKFGLRFPTNLALDFPPPFNSVFVNHVNDLTLFKCSHISKHHMCKKTCTSALVKIKWNISIWGYNCLNIRKETKMCNNGKILKEDSSIIKIKCIFALCYPLGTILPQRILGKIRKIITDHKAGVQSALTGRGKWSW